MQLTLKSRQAFSSVPPKTGPKIFYFELLRFCSQPFWGCLVDSSQNQPTVCTLPVSASARQQKQPPFLLSYVSLHRLHFHSHCSVQTPEGYSNPHRRDLQASPNTGLAAGLKLTPNRDPAPTHSSHYRVNLQQNFVKPETGFYFLLCPFKAIKIKRNLTNNLLCCTESLGI